MVMADEATTEHTRRDQAAGRVKKKRDFIGHLLMYLLMNAFLVVIWAITDLHGFFWPVFVIGGWGIAVVMNAWDVYWRRDVSELDIRREEERMTRRP